MAYRVRRVGGYRRTYRRTYYRRPRAYYGYRRTQAKNEALLILLLFRCISKIVKFFFNFFLRGISKIDEICKFLIKKYNDKHYGGALKEKSSDKNLSKNPLSAISNLKKEFEEQTSTSNLFSSSWEEEGDSILKGFYFSKERESEWKAFKTKRLQELKNITKNSIKLFNYEINLYKKFKNLANSDPDKKFKFEHIEQLDIGADITILYGKKGIGKTYQIVRVIQELVKKDPNAEVIIIKNKTTEFRDLHRQFQAENWPIIIKGITSKKPQIYFKDSSAPYTIPKHIGFCFSLNRSSLDKVIGEDFPFVRLIIWDESTSTGGRSSLKSDSLDDLSTFFNSVIKRERNVRIYIFGNSQNMSNGFERDALLSYLRISPSSKLKIKYKTSKDGQYSSTLLFINAHPFYKRTENKDTRLSVFSNKKSS